METANNVRTLPVARRVAPVNSLDLSAAWFALEGEPWITLAVVPATPALPARDVALSLLELGVRASLEPPTLIDGSALTPDGVAACVAQVEQAQAEGRRAIVLVDAPSACAAALALVRRCDAAVLCVGLGDTRLDEAHRTLERCGRDRFVGSIVLGEVAR